MGRGRVGRWLEWWLSPPVIVGELKARDRVLLRDGRVLTVERVRAMPEPPAWATVQIDVVDGAGRRDRLYQQSSAVLRRAVR